MSLSSPPDLSRERWGRTQSVTATLNPSGTEPHARLWIGSALLVLCLVLSSALLSIRGGPAESGSAPRTAATSQATAATPEQEMILLQGKAAATTENGASVTHPVVTAAQPEGRQSAVEFLLSVPPPNLRSFCEAESAGLTGCVVIANAAASGGKQVGAFGERVGDAITFPDLPAGNGVTIFYTNGADAPRQCSLYAGDRDVATVAFEDSGNFQGRCARARVDAPIKGALRLQVDADDRAANQKRTANPFCVDVDRVVGAPPRVEVSLPLRPLHLARGANVLRFRCAAPQGLVYSIALKDAQGRLYRSPDISQQEASRPQEVTLDFYDFKPAIIPEFLRSRIHSLQFLAANDSVPAPTLASAWKGTVRLADFRIAERRIEWPSSPPPDCPFEPSSEITGLVLTGRRVTYAHADTWYPSWAADGNLYSSFTDGRVAGVHSVSAFPWQVTGNAVIVGDHPLRLDVRALGTVLGATKPYNGRYPCANLVHNGIWYYGTYAVGVPGNRFGRDVGPFVGFRYSTDYGRTWTNPTLTPEKGLFGETAFQNNPIRMGSPHFVDFGRNMKHSPDGKAYLIAHGATSSETLQNFVAGDQINLARVTPSPATINDIRAYEFFAGFEPDGRTPRWTPRFADMRPLFRWDRAGCVTVTYNAPLRKYLMCISYGANPFGKFDTIILESDRITGPWRLVTYMRSFGEEAYFVNIPSKLISPDGRTLWLCFSANYAKALNPSADISTNPAGATYSLCLHEIELQVGGRP